MVEKGVHPKHFGHYRLLSKRFPFAIYYPNFAASRCKIRFAREARTAACAKPGAMRSGMLVLDGIALAIPVALGAWLLAQQRVSHTRPRRWALIDLT
jgi:hypothetical protein